MQKACCRHVEFVNQQARRELAAYLVAIRGVAGGSDVKTNGDRWIDMMESLEWPMDDYEDFFRRVTIASIFALVHDRFPA